MSVGRSVPRVDGPGKVTGRTRYSADMDIPGSWHGVIVRSDRSCGVLRGIAKDPGFDWSSVVLITAGDIPGENVVHGIEPDMPCLAGQRVSYLGEPIALVAAPSAAIARRAASLVRSEIEEEPALCGIEAIVDRFLSGGSDLTIFRDYRLECGDVEADLAASDVVVEGEYSTGAQEHAYLETQSMIAVPEGRGVRCLGSIQCPFYVRPAVAAVLGLPQEAVIVEQAPTGGAFGGKEDFPSLLASHASLLALACARPVRIVLERQEDISFTTKRHPSWARLRAGAAASGDFLALEGTILLDAGAYVTLSPVVLARSLLHACGPYRFRSVRLRALAVKSNMPPSGAFRGFGAPQSQFAIESHVDEMAAALGASPAGLRRRNVLCAGDTMATGQVLGKSVGGAACLDSVIGRCGFDEMRAAFDSWNSAASPAVLRGIGLASCLHGAGFTGNGERALRSRAGLRLSPDGTVEVLASSTEMGQGVLTAFAQIVADALSIPESAVRAALPDTSRVPDSGPTVASRSTMIVGGLLERAGSALVESIASRLGPGAVRDGEGFVTESGERLTWAGAAARAGSLSVEVEHEVDHDQVWDDGSFHGTAYPVFSWGAAAVEVEVDPGTFVVTPVKVWLAYEVGRAVNPLGVRGQLEGGSLQALGWALSERLGLCAGRWVENRLQTYVIPTSADTPEVDLDVVEIPFASGPGGAKGIGELPMNAVAAAVRNAVRHATGLRPDAIPIAPEDLLEMAGRAGR